MLIVLCDGGLEDGGVGLAAVGFDGLSSSVVVWGVVWEVECGALTMEHDVRKRFGDD